MQDQKSPATSYQSALSLEEGWNDLPERAKRLRDRAKAMQAAAKRCNDVVAAFARSIEDGVTALRAALQQAPDDVGLLRIGIDHAVTALTKDLPGDTLKIAGIGRGFGRGRQLVALHTIHAVAYARQASKQHRFDLVVDATSQVQWYDGTSDEIRRSMRMTLEESFEQLLIELSRVHQPNTHDGDDSMYSHEQLSRIVEEYARLFSSEQWDTLQQLSKRYLLTWWTDKIDAAITWQDYVQAYDLLRRQVLATQQVNQQQPGLRSPASTSLSTLAGKLLQISPVQLSTPEILSGLDSSIPPVQATPADSADWISDLFRILVSRLRRIQSGLRKQQLRQMLIDADELYRQGLEADAPEAVQQRAREQYQAVIDAAGNEKS